MHHYILFGVVIILLFMVGEALLHVYKPAISKRYFPRYNRSLEIYNILFQGIDGTTISMRERERLKLQDSTLTYGEITFDSFTTMLNLVKPKTGEIFYDLGCGTGKAVFIATLLFDFKKSCGIELLEPMYQLDLKLIEKFYNIPLLKKYFPRKQFSIEFIHSNFMHVDFSDADVVFINATCYTGDYWLDIIAKLDLLKIGTRIILSSRCLPHDRYQLLVETEFLMSWGLNSVNIYEKIKPRLPLEMTQTPV